MSQFGWDNCPPAVRRQVEELVQAVRERLAGNLVGVYLHGSLAAGCFNPDKSDLDLLVITRKGMSVETKRDLAQFLLDSSGRPCPIEIFFLTREDLSPWRHPTPYDFHFSEDWRTKFREALDTGTWRQWNEGHRVDEDLAADITMTRHRGLCLQGSPIEETFPPVPAGDCAASIVSNLERARSRLSQHPVYAVLNHCRAYAYLASGLISTKTEGALWALDVVPAEHGKVVSAALKAYRGEDRDTELDIGAARRFTDYIARRVAELQDPQRLETG